MGTQERSCSTSLEDAQQNSCPAVPSQNNSRTYNKYGTVIRPRKKNKDTPAPVPDNSADSADNSFEKTDVPVKKDTAANKRPVERPGPVTAQDVSSQELDFPTDNKGGRERPPADHKAPRRATAAGGRGATIHARPLVVPSASEEAVDLDSAETLDAPDLPDLYADSGELPTLSRGRQAARAASQRDSLSPREPTGDTDSPETLVEAPGTRLEDPGTQSGGEYSVAQRSRAAVHVGIILQSGVETLLMDRDSAETREVFDTPNTSAGAGGGFTQVQFRPRGRTFQLLSTTTTTTSTSPITTGHNNNNNINKNDNNNTSVKEEKQAPASVLVTAFPESNTTADGEVEVEDDSAEEEKTASPQSHKSDPITTMRTGLMSGTTTNDPGSLENLRDNSTEKLEEKTGDSS
ncbi:uncharacterized protein LOC134449859 [Engraulis encrasicolus]|uniref:uncharacterized protein LOC134449859 n=1 Tax=Engraulis encrasicolus TaxID=184585 RepID=UPI002FD38ADE